MTDPLLIGLGLLGIALLLVVVEVFIPSAGVISLIATVVAIAGIVALFRVSVSWGVAGILSMLVLGPTTALFALRILPSTPFGKKLLFGERGEAEPILADPAEDENRALMGEEGVAVTDMRPVGAIRVGGKRMQATSEVAMIRAGTAVRIMSVEGNHIRVRPVV